MPEETLNTCAVPEEGVTEIHLTLKADEDIRRAVSNALGPVGELAGLAQEARVQNTAALVMLDEEHGLRVELQGKLLNVRHEIDDVIVGLRRREADCETGAKNVIGGDVTEYRRLTAKASAYGHAAELVESAVKRALREGG